MGRAGRFAATGLRCEKTDELELNFAGATSSLYAAIDQLQASGVIRPLTNRSRNQVWVVSAVADELDSLAVRIASRAREEMQG